MWGKRSTYIVYLRSNLNFVLLPSPTANGACKLCRPCFKLLGKGFEVCLLDQICARVSIHRCFTRIKLL